MPLLYNTGIPYIASELQADAMPITLTTALYILVTGIAPVIWASISDHYHIRRNLILLALVIFSISSLISALIHNIWILIALRCFQGVGASCALSVGPGVISDCYPVDKRGSAFAKFYYGVFVGPLIGKRLIRASLASSLVSKMCLYYRACHRGWTHHDQYHMASNVLVFACVRDRPYRFGLLWAP